LKPERLLTIDALRGIAALAVALFHLHLPTFAVLDNPGLNILSGIFRYGYLGVAIFFVISGFVIASTIKTQDVTFPFVGKYMVKRAVRLDPPYWLSMAVDLTIIWISIHALHMQMELPSVRKVVAHLFYLQDLLGFGGMSAIYWTLCMEVQFYIFFGLVFAVYNRLRAPRYFLACIFVGTTILSMVLASGAVSNPLPGIFLPLWYSFVAGAVCYWCTLGERLPRKCFFILLAALCVLFAVQAMTGREAATSTLIVTLTAVFLYIAGVRHKLSSWLRWRPLLYLGSISYSLYLFHGIVGERFISLMRDWILPWLGVELPPVLRAIALFLGALVGSVLAAHLVYRYVERPALMIARKIRPASSESLPKQIFKDNHDG